MEIFIATIAFLLFIIYAFSKNIVCCPKKLKLKSFKNKNLYKDKYCPICLEELITETSSLLNNNNEIVYLEICNNSNHPFHRKCILESIKQYGNRCPVCRADHKTHQSTINISNISNYGTLQEV